jgi:uncharacterized membrane protein YcaP (DUF421 family)
VIMLGSIFSRVVVGASPFLGTTLACFAFVLVHRLLGWVSLYSDFIGRLVKGEATSLYANGKANTRNMHADVISEKDLLESVRQRINENNLDNVSEIMQVRNGEVSVIKKWPDPNSY